MTFAKVTIGIGMAVLAGVAVLCLTHCGGAPTRARIEASEDQFCALVAEARTLERVTGTLPDAGPPK